MSKKAKDKKDKTPTEPIPDAAGDDAQAQSIQTSLWKLSPMDLKSRERWVEYSMAKDAMFASTDIKQAPWYVVNSDSKPRARLNCISHLLSLIPYEDLTPEPLVLPPQQSEGGYVRPPVTDQTFVPEVF